MEPEPYDIPDVFGEFRVFPNLVEPSNMEAYSQEVIRRAREIVNEEFWAAVHIDELNGP